MSRSTAQSARMPIGVPLGLAGGLESSAMRGWIAVVVLAGCSVEQLPPEDPNAVARSACYELEGLRFESVVERECGLGPTGPVPCKWSVTFSANDATSSSFSWRYSDVGEGGDVECEGTQLHVSANQAIAASYDPSTSMLIWQGDAYAIAP